MYICGYNSIERQEGSIVTRRVPGSTAHRPNIKIYSLAKSVPKFELPSQTDPY